MQRRHSTRTVLRPIPITPNVRRTRPDKTAEVVARGLVDEIIVNGRHPGDSLDSEQVMLDRFGVSRESLREALRLLEVQGLVVIKRGPGGGAFVGIVDPANLGRISSLYFHMAGASYGELLDAYAVAEATLAQLAAQHADAAARREAMAPYVSPRRHDGDVDTYVEHHAEFHTAVARLANNRVLEISLPSLGLLVGAYYLAQVDPRVTAGFVPDDHAAIATAIAAGRSTRAAELMGEHVRRVGQALVDGGLDPTEVIGWA